MSSPFLSHVRHTALGLGPTLNPGCAHLKIFSLIPSETSLLQMRSCSHAPGPVFWRGHQSTCDIHQNGAVKFLNPTSVLHLVSSDPWAAPFSAYPMPRPPGTTPPQWFSSFPLRPSRSLPHLGEDHCSSLPLVQVKNPGSGIDSSPAPTSNPTGSSMGSVFRKDPESAHISPPPPNHPRLSLDTLQAS